jgi:sec-independent protein translocase protein TatB
MNLSEVMVTLVVALLVFGPKQLPMVAHHLGKLMNRITRLKQLIATYWQQQLNEQQLKENTRKAEDAEEHP